MWDEKREKQLLTPRDFIKYLTLKLNILEKHLLTNHLNLVYVQTQRQMMEDGQFIAVNVLIRMQRNCGILVLLPRETH